VNTSKQGNSSIAAAPEKALGCPARETLIGCGALLLTALFSFLPLASAGEPRLWPVTAATTLLILHHGKRWLPHIAVADLLAASSLGRAPDWQGGWLNITSILLIGLICFTMLPLIVAGSLHLVRRLSRRSGALSILGILCCISAGSVFASLLWQLVDLLITPAGGINWEKMVYRALALGIAPLLAVPVYRLSGSRKSWLATTSWRDFLPWLAISVLFIFVIINYQTAALLLVLPLFLWSSARMGSMPSMVLNGSIVLTLLMLLPTVSSRAPYADFIYQAQLIVFFFSGLFLSASIADRRRIEARLEDRVLQRTQDLQQINQELQDEVFIRKQAEKSLLASSRKYRSLIETAGSPIVILDRKSRIRQWNKAASELFGYRRDDIQHKDFVKTFLPRTFQEETTWKINKVFETGQTLENLENEIIDANGNTQVMLWNVSRFMNPHDDGDNQVIVIGQNITSIRETQNQLHFLAHYDVLTGASNRRLFEDRCRQALKQGARNGHDVGLLGLDIDHFKRVNDTLGHDKGDELLKILFSRMQDCVREEDTIARLGGDEFAILLNKVNGIEGCAKVADNLLKSITRPVQLPGQQLIITTSIGVTLAPRDGNDFTVLLKNADMAMYRAKKKGRNNVQFYEAEMGAEVAHQLSIEQALRQGLDQNEFILYFQPQIDLEDNRVTGFEALLRWHHPQKGLLTPMHFLDIAEQSGLLPTLGKWVIDNVVKQAAMLQKRAGQPMQVSANLSGRELRHPGLVTNIRDALEHAALDPKLLSFEVSEPAIVANIDDSIRALKALKTLGVSLTIDSFGSGLTSLSHLASMPVDTLKIHHSLIRRVPAEPYDTAIFNTLVAISQGMEIRLIVEGVETEAQEDYIRSKGIRYVQGHRFSPPIPADQLAFFFEHLSNGEIARAKAQLGLQL
jgi:diguanylate cyclase (GGDEF)-like protein/PAS domain S-box-containing protein